jgi:hypothetical protein
MADLAPDWTPYRYGFNNPVKYSDTIGMFEYVKGGYGEDIEVGNVWSHTEDGRFLSDQKRSVGDKKTYDGGTLNQVTVTASRITDAEDSGNNYSLGDFGTGLSLAGAGMWLLGGNRSTSLYQQGFRRGLSGNYQLTGKKPFFTWKPSNDISHRAAYRIVNFR